MNITWYQMLHDELIILMVSGKEDIKLPKRIVV